MVDYPTLAGRVCELAGSGTVLPPGDITQLLAQDETLIERAVFTVKRMYDAGVEIHTGSDALIPFVVPGASLHRELRIFVDAGFTPEEALALSTRTSAAYLGVPNLGSLEVGAPADFVIFREDPTRSLDALDSIAAVVRDGRLYPRAVLDEQLAKYQAHFNTPLYEAIVTPLVRRALAQAREH
jgi:imidazolonepropionase-like amidohydrolase